MAIKTIIELQAKPGQRDQLLSIMDEVTTMQAVPGFLGFEFYEVLENPDGLVEIAEWESPEARQTWIQQSMDSGALNLLMLSLDAPFKATNIQPIP